MVEQKWKHTSWIVLKSGNQIAIAERVVYGPQMFGLFGGSIDDGEMFDAGAQRELREEAGLDISIDRFIPKAELTLSRHTLHVYEVEIADPVFKINPEHKSVGWVDIEAAKQLPLHWCAKQILQKVY